MADEKIIFDILTGLNTVKSDIDALKGSAAGAQKSLSLIAGAAFIQIGAAALSAASAVVGFGKSVADEAAQADTNLTSLNTALKLSGDFSEKASKQFQALAESIQATTVFDNDAALQSLALAKAFGATNDQAEKLTKAATQLATVQGISLTEATSQLGKTLDGTAGKLAETIPGLRSFTAAQLQAGAAVDFVNSRFGGAAQSAATTFAGAIKQNENAFKDLEKAAGAVITQNPVFVGGIRALTAIFNQLEILLRNNQTAIVEFINNGLLVIASAANIAIKALGILVKTSNTINLVLIGLGESVANLVTSFLRLGGIPSVIAGIGGAISSAFADILDLFSKLFASIESNPVLSNFFKKLGIDLAGVQAPLKDAADSMRTFGSSLDASKVTGGLNAIDSGLAGARSAAVAASGAVSSAFNAAENASDKFTAGVEKNSKKQIIAVGSGADGIKNEFQAVAALSEDTLKKISQDIIKNPFDALFKNNESANIFFGKAIKKAKELDLALHDAVEENNVNAIKSIQEAIKNNKTLIQDVEFRVAISAAAGIAENITKGFQGAVTLAKSAVTTIVSALGPIGQALGPIAGEIFGALAQGPAKVKEMVTSFIEAIPTIIENVLLSIPAIIEALIVEIPRVIDRMVEEIPRVVQSIIDHLPELIVQLTSALVRASLELSNQMPFIAAQLAISLIAQTPHIAVEFVNQLVKEAPRFVTELIKSIGDSIGSLGGIFGGGGGGGGGGDIFSGIGDFFGFADGGTVPGGAPFTDRIPSLLTPNETVIDRSLSKRLDSFLSGQTPGQGGAPTTIQLVVGEQQLANVILDLNRRGFRLA